VADRSAAATGFRSLVGLDSVDGPALHWHGDVRIDAASKQHRHEFIARRTGIIKMLVVKAPLPADAVSRPRLFLTIDPTEIGLGAYHEYEIGPADLPLAPIRPAFRRRLDILVDDRVDAVGPQPVGEPEHPVAMLVTVVAVADENPRHRNVRHGRLFSLSSAIVWSGGCLAKAAVAIC